MKMFHVLTKHMVYVNLNLCYEPIINVNM